ncbi:MAG: Cys-Cys-COOH (seleno)protein SaoC [Lagierella massiliensis]|nr:Cys-Cys-COOH (seleno)protein SaoC [Lagierella massiliensis]
MEKLKSSVLTKFLLLVIVFFIGYLGYRNNVKYNKVDFGVETDHYLLQAFYDKFPGKEVIKCRLGDVNGDDREDLIIIFRETKDINHLIVAMDLNEKISFSDQTSAPYENQKIELKDIDNEPPKEFIVSGSKRGQYGYGIFRIEDKHLHNLFSEGMGVC